VTQPELAAASAPLALVSFRVGASSYAIDASCILEIVPSQPLVALPNAPPLIQGVMDLRGVLVPVADLARVLGDPAGVAEARSRIVVVRSDELVLGLRVDAALEVLGAESARLGPAPALGPDGGCDAVEAVLHRADGPPLLVLSLGHVVRVIRGRTPGGSAS
jgi:purine-binding chemotaxis protein CheW